MPLMPAMRPIDAINKTADMPIKTPPMSEEIQGCISAPILVIAMDRI